MVIDMSYEILTDSSANLPESMIDEFGVHILSLVFRINEEEFYGYVKGQTTDLSQFYKRMRNKENITTSLVNMEVCE